MNEINLIDREDCAEIIEARAEMSIGTYAQGVFAAAARMIRALPAVDAEPVRHGRWVAAESPAHLAAIKCSECNTMFHLRWKAYLIFCPRCGAKMDLEE